MPKGKRTTVTFEDGRTFTFRSIFEGTVAVAMERDGVSDWEFEEYVLPFTVPHLYTPDFTFPKKDGELIYVEAKGQFPADQRQKMKHVKRCHPDHDIRFVFQNPSTKIHKGAKQTLGEWADKHGFPWAGKKIPKEWYRE